MTLKEAEHDLIGAMTDVRWSIQAAFPSLPARQEAIEAACHMAIASVHAVAEAAGVELERCEERAA